MKFLTTFVGRVFPLSGRRVHTKEQEYAGQKSVDRMETGRMEERNSQKSDTGFRILDVGCQNVGILECWKIEHARKARKEVKRVDPV